MATLGMVEKLKQHADVSYDEAKEALDACNDDILEAIIYLEKKGKVSPPKNNGTYTADREPAAPPPPPAKEYDQGETFGQLMRRFFRWLKRVVRKGNHNQFVIEHKGSEFAAFPITLLVILLLVSFYITGPLLIVGLFFGFRYHFRGRDIESTGVNRVMDTVTNAAGDIKQSIAGEFHKDKGNRDEHKDSDH